MIISIYIAVLLLTVCILFICMFNIRRQKTALSKTMSYMQCNAMIAIIANIFYVASLSEISSNIGFSLFSVMIDWILIAMYFFVEKYVDFTRKHSGVVYVCIALAVADSISIMLNVFFGHVFTLKERVFFQIYHVYEATDFTSFYHIHLAFCYVIVLGIVILLVRSVVKSSHFYRSRYLVILSLFFLLLVLDALCVIVHAPLNVSILFYGGLAIVIAYYAIYYQPQRLLNDVHQMIMENINNGIVCFDDKGKCIYVNDCVWEMFHLEKDEHILEDFTYENGELPYQKEEPYSIWMEERIIAGEKRYFELERQQIYDKRNILVATYFNMKDQTERQLLHEKEIDMEKEANRNKSDFLSRVSHDIRTPINSISGMNEMILNENTDETINEYAWHIKEAVDILH